MNLSRHTLTAVVLAAVASLAYAAPTRVASGSSKGYSCTAESTVVGQVSTGTLTSGGSALYTAPMPQYSGVVSLIMAYAGGSFNCSGTLLPDRQSILTAGHCVTDGPTLSNPITTTAYF